MTIISFFNANPPGVIVAPNAFDGCIGSIITVKNALGETGGGFILDAKVQDGGVYITYETDLNLGVKIDLDVSVIVGEEMTFEFDARPVVETRPGSGRDDGTGETSQETV